MRFLPVETALVPLNSRTDDHGCAAVPAVRLGAAQLSRTAILVISEVWSKLVRTAKRHAKFAENSHNLNEIATQRG